MKSNIHVLMSLYYINTSHSAFSLNKYDQYKALISRLLNTHFLFNQLML